MLVTTADNLSAPLSDWPCTGFGLDLQRQESACFLTLAPRCSSQLRLIGMNQEIHRNDFAAKGVVVYSQTSIPLGSSDGSLPRMAGSDPMTASCVGVAAFRATGCSACVSQQKVGSKARRGRGSQSRHLRSHSERQGRAKD